MRQAVFIATQRSLPGLISISLPPPSAPGLLHPPSFPPSHPPSLARAKSSSSSRFLSFSLSSYLSRILLKIAARVLGTESEGKGYPGHVGERGNSFNRLIILFKPVAPLARPTPVPPVHLTLRLCSSPAACWLTLFARIMNSLEKGGEASARNENRVQERRKGLLPLCLFLARHHPEIPAPAKLSNPFHPPLAPAFSLANPSDGCFRERTCPGVTLSGHTYARQNLKHGSWESTVVVSRAK